MKTSQFFLMLAVLLSWATGAGATQYITDVMLIGAKEINEVHILKQTYEAQGWTCIDQDLNENAGGDYIYLLYKAEDTGLGYGVNNGQYITDFYIKTGSGRPASISHEGRTYYPVPGGGNDTFNNSSCDLNRDAGGDYIYLFYTKDTFSDNRAITDISFNDGSEGAVGANGGSSGYDLNKGGGGDYIYMHLTTAAASTPQVLWCSAANTLYFTCSVTAYQAGSTYDGLTVTSSWNGTSVVNTGWSTPGWDAADVAGSVKKVVVSPDFQSARPKSLNRWFCGMNSLTEIEGLENLNTSETTNMNSTFHGCKGLTTLDVRGFIMRKVSNTSAMFGDCTALTTIYCNDVWTIPADAGVYMFGGDEKLKGAVPFNQEKTDVGMANPHTGYFTGLWLLKVYSHDHGTMLLANGKNKYYPGETVALTPDADEGYLLREVVAKGDWSGQAVSITDNGDGTYSLLMPHESVTVSPTFGVATQTVTYVDRDGAEQTVEAMVLRPEFTTLDGGWWAVAGSISASDRLTMKGNVNLILCDGATLTNPKGTTVASGDSLTIWAQRNGTGAWSVSSPDTYSAGIGGRTAPSGAITINGGDITAVGGKYGAGIGGGYAYRYRSDNSGIKTSRISINGGVVSATGGIGGAGIGAGEYGDAEVSISGGTVNASAGTGASGIGDGYNSTGSAVSLSYTDQVSITADSYGGVVTLVKPFTDGTLLHESGVEADNSLLAGRTLVPLRRGDVNLDGRVTIADVSMLVNVILGKSETSSMLSDVNGDGQVTIADVTTLVNIILGKPVGSEGEVIGVDGSGGVEYGGGGSGPARTPRTSAPSLRSA